MNPKRKNMCHDIRYYIYTQGTVSYVHVHSASGVLNSKHCLVTDYYSSLKSFNS